MILFAYSLSNSASRKWTNISPTFELLFSFNWRTLNPTRKSIVPLMRCETDELNDAESFPLKRKGLTFVFVFFFPEPVFVAAFAPSELPLSNSCPPPSLPCSIPLARTGIGVCLKNSCKDILFSPFFFFFPPPMTCDVCFLSLSLSLSLSYVKNESVLHKTQVVVLFLIQRRTFIVLFNVFFL